MTKLIVNVYAGGGSLADFSFSAVIARDNQLVSQLAAAVHAVLNNYANGPATDYEPEDGGYTILLGGKNASVFRVNGAPPEFDDPLSLEAGTLFHIDVSQSDVCVFSLSVIESDDPDLKISFINTRQNAVSSLEDLVKYAYDIAFPN